MMLRRIAVLSALLVSAPAFAANLATPTATRIPATPVATPQKQDKVVQIMGRGQCVFDLGAVPTPVAQVTPSLNFAMRPGIVKVTCGAPGAQVGDIVFGRMATFDAATSDYDALSLRGCSVKTANQIDCMLSYVGVSVLDPAALTIDYVVFH
jgi:hypothetical protein